MNKLDWYMAIFVGDPTNMSPNERNLQYARMWDMLRYDRCYPATNNPRFDSLGFIVLKQSYQDGVDGGFTVGRWKSIGFRDCLVIAVETQSGIPVAMEDQCLEFVRQRKKWLYGAPSGRE